MQTYKTVGWKPIKSMKNCQTSKCWLIFSVCLGVEVLEDFLYGRVFESGDFPSSIP